MSDAMQEADQEVGMLCAAAASQDLDKSVRMNVSVPWCWFRLEQRGWGLDWQECVTHKGP